VPVWKPIARLQALTLAFPREVLAACALLLGVALLLGSGVEFRSSRSELAPRHDPDERRLREMMRQFHGAGSLVVCVEAEPGKGADREGLRRVAGEVAAAVSADPLVAGVYYRADREWLLEHALYLMPPATLRRLVDTLGPLARSAGDAPRVDGIEGLNRLLAAGLREGLRQGTAFPDDPRVEGPLLLARLLEFERRLLEDPERTATALAAQDPWDWLASFADGADGYLQTRDGAALFVVVTPREGDDSLPVLRRFVGAVRERALAVVGDRDGFRVGFTGQPAIAVEEMETVRGDTVFSSLLAMSGVTLLTLLVFRRKRHALLVLVALAVGLGWAFGAVRLEIGYLNMITSAFLATLIGVGVAYGIHPVSEFELAARPGADRREAVRESYRRTGPGVTVAAVTTATAFLSILLMRYRGFAELGLVAGVGVLLCLASFMLTLPALLALFGRPSPSVGSGRSEPVLDRLWNSRVARRICRFPRATVAVALALSALSAWSVGRVGFNTNILDLLPANSESLHYLLRMTADSDFSPVFNLVATKDLDELREMRERAAREPAISRFDSVLHFLPEQPRAGSEAAAALGDLVDAIRLPAAPRPVDREGLIDSLAELERLFDEAAEAAFTAGLKDVLGPLERARAASADAARIAREAPAGTERGWDAAQQESLSLLAAVLAMARRAARADPPTVETLPDAMRRRFVLDDGSYVGLLFPAGSVFDPVELEPYVAASRRVSEDAIGPPMLFWEMSRRITSGFYRSVAVGAALVFVVLLLDFRRLRDVALASFPLGLGVLWMIGGMHLLGLDFNFANLVGVTLIIGAGIDNGVHVIHRVRLEGREGMDVVLRHTGRAIVISSLTTMVGFGSLALANHLGLASLGKVLLLGVGSCLVTSIVVLPNLLVALGVVRR